MCRSRAAPAPETAPIPTPLRCASFAALAALLCASAPGALAQLPPAAPIERPGAPAPFTPPPLVPLPRPAPPALDLPLPFPLERERAPAGLGFLLRRVELEGNTVLDPAAVAEITRDYENRQVDSEAIEDLRLRLTRLYISRGYVNSGVVVPDQDIADGVLTLRAIEGRLTRIEIAGDALRLRRGYIEPRLALGAGHALNLNRLRERIEIMQQDGPIDRINAEIVPDLAPGDAVLRARIVETQPFQVGITVNNQRNTAVGETRGEFVASHRNVTGWGDRAEVRFGLTEGVEDYSVAYSVPVTPRDTLFTISRSQTDSLLIDPALRALNISNESLTEAVSIEHPLWRSPEATLRISVARERRRSETFILNAPFSFTPGIPDSGARLGLWRFGASWLGRGADSVLSARVQLTRGSANVGDSVDPSTPARTFTAWLGQLHWGRRLPELGSQIIARVEFQETRDVLLPMERFGVGGANSVRGYQEYQLLRDRGRFASVEYRHPLLGKERPEVQFAGFVDYGQAANRDGRASFPGDIAGTGVGLLFTPNRQVHMQIYAAHRLRDVPVVGERGMQDRGVHFSATYLLF